MKLKDPKWSWWKKWKIRIFGKKYVTVHRIPDGKLLKLTMKHLNGDILVLKEEDFEFDNNSRVKYMSIDDIEPDVHKLWLKIVDET